MYQTNEYESLIEALRKAEPSLREQKKIDSERKAEDTRMIIAGATRSLGVLGINCLRPAHEGIEPVARILGNGGDVAFMTLDPFGEDFSGREIYERTQLGRLQTEWEAAMCDLADAHKRAGSRGNLRIYLYNRKPALSMAVADPATGGAVMQVNFYPKESGSRGLTGKTYLLELGTKSDDEIEAFQKAIIFFNGLESFHDTRAITPGLIGSYVAQSKRLWLERYARCPDPSL